MNSKAINWLIFATISLIWGSSFILMKLGMSDARHLPTLSAIQVASLRIVSAGLALSPFLFKDFKSIPKSNYKALLLSGLLGIFLPAFLFCIAETRITSSLTGTVNALTPLFVILSAWVLFKKQVPMRQSLGIVIGFAGTLLLFFAGNTGGVGDIGFAMLVVLATLCYGLNANLVRHSLSGLSSVTIAAFSFCMYAVPAILILILSGFFKLPLGTHSYVISSVAACVLGVIGSAFAWIIFYTLIKRSSALFASSATYAIPFVALAWGWIYGEKITVIQIVCLVIILVGVYLSSPAPASKAQA